VPAKQGQGEGEQRRNHGWSKARAGARGKSKSKRTLNKGEGGWACASKAIKQLLVAKRCSETPEKPDKTISTADNETTTTTTMTMTTGSDLQRLIHLFIKLHWPSACNYWYIMMIGDINFLLYYSQRPDHRRLLPNGNPP
jgi:hypothetical protein